MPCVEEGLGLGSLCLGNQRRVCKWLLWGLVVLLQVRRCCRFSAYGDEWGPSWAIRRALGRARMGKVRVVVKQRGALAALYMRCVNLLKHESRMEADGRVV